jgi:hypothetical protein
MEENLLNGLASFGMGFTIASLLIGIFMIISMWKVFQKAGQPGWAVLVPFYNLYVFIKVAGKPGWWFFGIFLSLIPFAGVVLVIIWEILLFHGISKNFGKDAGFTVGLILLGIVFFPILAFGDAEYQPVTE